MTAATRATGDAPATSDLTRSPDTLRSRRYLAALAGGVLASLALFYLLLLALAYSGRLAPPAFVNSLCADEKLRYLRDARPASPDLLIVGSSVAWRHVDGSLLAPASGYRQVLNGGICGLRMNQSVFVADWLLGRLPTVTHVVLLASPVDFAACRFHPAAVFDRHDVDRYVFEHASPWRYYMTYFSPRGVVRGALNLKDERSRNLVFTPSGDGPLTVITRQSLHYGPPDPLDPTCFAALTSLAKRLQGEGKLLTVVTTPLHPAWRAAYDPHDNFLRIFDARITQALGPGGHRLWDAAREWPVGESAFSDAIHLQWSAVAPFTQALAGHLRAQAAAAH